MFFSFMHGAQFLNHYHVIPMYMVKYLNKIVSCYYSQRPHKATADEMTKFHSDEYIRFLRSIRPDNMSEYNKQMQRCKILLIYH